MAWCRRSCRGLVALSLALAGSLAQAGPYSAMYVFGDSLSDSGNDFIITGGILPSSAYYTDGTHSGRFTNGLNYADRLAADFGLTLTPSQAGGNNYAYGGARSDYARADLAAFGARSFNAQIGQYLSGAGNAADPNALYVLWIGANDISDAISQSLMAGGDPTPIQNEIGQTVGDIVTALVTLESLGAKHFVIGNSPDLSLTPSVRGLASIFGAGVQTLAQGASMAFNSALSFYVPANTFATSDVTMFDAFGLQTAMTDHPADYGISNVTSGCYNGQVDGTPTPGAGPITECPNPNQYIYFDTEHPSATLHEWAARTIYAQLVPEPAQWALTLTALGLLGFAPRRQRRD